MGIGDPKEYKFCLSASALQLPIYILSTLSLSLCPTLPGRKSGPLRIEFPQRNGSSKSNKNEIHNKRHYAVSFVALATHAHYIHSRRVNWVNMGGREVENPLSCSYKFPPPSFRHL